jgi:hypothetical protein
MANPNEFIRYQQRQYSWNSSIANVDGQPWKGFTAHDHEEGLDVETVYAQDGSGAPLGSTDGQYEVSGFSFKMLAEYWTQLRLYLANLAPGAPAGNRGPIGNLGKTVFTYHLILADDFAIGATPVDILIPFARVLKPKVSLAKGNTAIEYEIACWASQVIVNGTTLWSQPTI